MPGAEVQDKLSTKRARRFAGRPMMPPVLLSSAPAKRQCNLAWTRDNRTSRVPAQRCRLVNLNEWFQSPVITGRGTHQSRIRGALTTLRRLKPGGRMKHETSLALYAYWQSCRRGLGVRAGGLRATELAPILTSLFLFDTPHSGDFRLRFCGAALATRYGRDLSDENFLSLWNAEDRDTLERNLRFSGPRSTGLVAGTLDGAGRRTRGAEPHSRAYRGALGSIHSLSA
jgi:hypothetical protein